MTTTLSDVISSKIGTFKDDLYTSLPAVITSVDNYSTEGTISAQPSVARVLTTGQTYEPPILEDVPVQLVAGGGAYISMPLAVGDEVLLVFSMRDTEEWFASTEGIVTPEVLVWHDISDAFAIPCVFRPANSPKPSSSNLEIKFKDSIISVSPDNTVTIDNGTGRSVINSNGTITNTTSSTYAVQGAVDELVSLINDLATQVAAITTQVGGSPVPINNAAAVAAIQAKISAFVE